MAKLKRFNEQQLKLFNYEEEEIQKLLLVYEKARKNIASELLDGMPTEYNKKRLKILFKQCDEIVSGLQKKLNISIDDINKYTIDAATADMVGLLKTLSVAIPTNLVRINQDVIKIMVNSDKRYISGLLSGGWDKIKDEIVQGVILGESHDKLIRRLMANKDSIWVDQQYKRSISTVRNFVNSSYNQSHLDVLRSIGENDPEMQKQWYNALDVLTTRICRELTGQVRDVDTYFVAGGWRGLRPPAIGYGAIPRFHYCRSRIIPYKRGWNLM